ncbi:thioesterase family protein, partial [Shewanella sp. SR41-2]|nr:thioesterase family protein [Shewanella sp. SR41-2]
RSGNRVSVCRMELHNEQGVHIAFGTGTYMVG